MRERTVISWTALNFFKCYAKDIIKRIKSHRLGEIFVRDKPDKRLSFKIYKEIRGDSGVGGYRTHLSP